MLTHLSSYPPPAGVVGVSSFVFYVALTGLMGQGMRLFSQGLHPVLYCVALSGLVRFPIPPLTYGMNWLLPTSE